MDEYQIKIDIFEGIFTMIRLPQLEAIIVNCKNNTVMTVDQSNVNNWTIKFVPIMLQDQSNISIFGIKENKNRKQEQVLFSLFFKSRYLTKDKKWPSFGFSNETKSKKNVNITILNQGHSLIDVMD